MWLAPFRREGGLPSVNPKLHAALVDSLFGDLVSLALGALGGLAATSLLAWTLDSVALWYLSGALVYIGAWRVFLFLSYRRTKREDGIANPRRWEFGYLAGAYAFSLAIGAVCIISVMNSPDPGVHLLAAVITIAYTAGITGRNAGRPLVVAGQVLFTIGPMAVALVWHGGALYQVAAFMLVLYMLSVRGILRSTHAMFSGTLEATQRSEALAVELDRKNRMFDVALGSLRHGLCIVDRRGNLTAWNARFLEIFGLEASGVGEGAPLSRLVSSRVETDTTGSLGRLETLEAFSENLRSTWRSTASLALSCGKRVLLTFDPLPEGGMVVLMEELTESAADALRLAELARDGGSGGR